MPNPPDLTPPLIRDLAQGQFAQTLTEPDAAAIARLLTGLAADMRAVRQMTVAEADEPATTYAAIEGQP
jgi:hypothetical protein